MSKYRSHNIADLQISDDKEYLKICGRVERTRLHPNIIFFDLKDASGLVQCALKKADDLNLFNEVFKNIKPHCMISADGALIKRSPNFVNAKLLMGQVEFHVSKLRLLSKPTIYLDGADMQEANRFKYRYLDLRSDESMNAIKLRSWLIHFVHRFFDRKNFTYVNTPLLAPSTPEGARDFLVFSKNCSGRAYALPQSPQLFKQILMIAGIENYYQLASCFRDEDLRANRQPEFTQLDLEMAWVDEMDVRNVLEEFLLELIDEYQGEKLDKIGSISYADSLKFYGTDAPNTSIEGMYLKHDDEFTIICVDQPIEDRKEHYLKYLQDGKVFQVKDAKDGLESRLADASNVNIDSYRFHSTDNSYIFYSASSKGMSELRDAVAKDFGLIKPGLHPIWVTDFPMFNLKEGKLEACHHPFTCFEMTEEDPTSWKAVAYDIVINGQEVGGGSLRNTDPDLLERVFNLLGYSSDYVQEHFSFFLNALRVGVPPHGGLALGFERLLSIMLGHESIRNVIAFPKSQAGTCFMTGAPTVPSLGQMAELGLKFID